jgi:hypothetical protein
MAPKFIPFKDVEQLADIDQLAYMLDLQLRRYGASGQLRCACPVHGGDDDALAISPGVRSRRGSMGVFFCRPGQSGGDRIGLVAHVMEMGQQDAAFFIASQFGMDIEDDGTGHSTVMNNSSATVPPAREKAPQQAASKPPTPFDPAAFAEKLEYTEAVSALGISEEDAHALGIGHYRGKTYIAMRYDTGDIAGFAAVEGAKLPSKLLPKADNVIPLRQRA